MVLRIIFILCSLQFLVACGGGGGNDGGNVDPFSVDADTLPGDGSVGQLALGSSEVENSLCFAQVPSYRELNDSYFNKALVQPTSDFYFDYIVSENEYGSQESTLSFMGQNKEVYDVLAALLFNVKDTESSTGQPPIYLSPRKPIYNEIRGFCRDIQCAADSVFGDSWGLRFLLKDKFGVLLSGLVKEKTIEYSDNDFLNSAAQAVLSLPKGTFPLKKENFVPTMHDYSPTNVVIAPYTDGEVPAQGMESAAGVTRSQRVGGMEVGTTMLVTTDVYLLDPWKQSRDFYGRLYTVFHELIHVLDQAQEKNVVLSESAEWLKISDWRERPDKSWVMVKDNLKCSEYGSTLPQEDFAECGSLYRFAPNRLKKISKAKYNFFKKRVFSGVEYNQISKCQNSVPTFDL